MINVYLKAIKMISRWMLAYIYTDVSNLYINVNCIYGYRVYFGKDERKFSILN